MRIAVVTTCYNQAHYLRESIASVAAARPDYHILVDDGSTDETFSIMQGVVDGKRVRAIHHDVNRGHGVAMNTGIRAACDALWCLKVDADDTIEPSYVDEIRRISSAQTDLTCIYSPCHFFGDQNGIYRYKPYNAAMIDREFQIPGPSAMRRDVWMQLGGFDETMRYGEDWDFWIRASRLGLIVPHQLDRPLWNYRIHSGPRVSREGMANIGRLKSYWKGHTAETVRAGSRTWGAWCQAVGAAA